MYCLILVFCWLSPKKGVTNFGFSETLAKVKWLAHDAVQEQFRKYRTGWGDYNLSVGKLKYQPSKKLLVSTQKGDNFQWIVFLHCNGCNELKCFKTQFETTESFYQKWAALTQTLAND